MKGMQKRIDFAKVVLTSHALNDSFTAAMKRDESHSRLIG